MVRRFFPSSSYGSLDVLVLLLLVSCTIILAGDSPSSSPSAPTSEYLSLRLGRFLRHKNTPTSSSSSSGWPSRRLIVELEAEPLSTYLFNPKGDQKRASLEEDDERTPGWVWRTIRRDPDAREHASRIVSERRTFLAALAKALETDADVTRRQPGEEEIVSRTADERLAVYSLLINGLSLRVPQAYADRPEEFVQLVKSLPHVTRVTREKKYQQNLFATINAINATLAYNSPAIGNVSNAGAGIKIASFDSGLYYASPMFNGSSYAYPPGWPAGGLGLTYNNNGKIIASRTYIRSDDPPLSGEGQAYPGPIDSNGDNSHGVHTGSTAAGEFVTATVGDKQHAIHGVAPKAWLMSYRLFYPSVSNPTGTFYDTEGIMALEDIIEDGANVIINSWGKSGEAGGIYDPLDRSLINAARAGLFLAMAAGNAGPALTTSNHPSTDYITVAAATVSTYQKLDVSVVGNGSSVPSNVASPLLGSPVFFGNPISVQPVTLEFVALEITEMQNPGGCSTITTNLVGKAVIMPQLSDNCTFSRQVARAQTAGAALAIIYSRTDSVFAVPGSDTSITMPSVYMGFTNGKKFVSWYSQVNGSHPVYITVRLNVNDASAQPDVITSFSSRGPSMLRSLKPDISAPGSEVLAQGFAYGYKDLEAYKHFGTASGTSMATPHVAGASALVKQMHPNWSPRQIKAALMGTARWRGMTTESGDPAQPLDMGAGMLDLSKVADPGALLDPPSLSFGYLLSGDQRNITVTVANVGNTQQTFAISSAYSGGPSGPVQGISYSPAELTLNPGSEEQFVVTFDSSELASGDHQGFLILNSDLYEVSMPLWTRVLTPTANTVLLLNGMGSAASSSVLNTYTSTLSTLGVPYYVVDALSLSQSDIYWVSAYPMMIYFSGLNGILDDGSYPSDEAMDMLRQYLVLGGRLFVTGPLGGLVMSSLSAYLPSPATVSITNFNVPTSRFNGWLGAPAAFKSVSFAVYQDLYQSDVVGELSIVSSGQDESGDDWVSMLYYTRNPNPYQVLSGIVCAGVRSQPTVTSPGEGFNLAAIVTMLGLETISSATERLKFTSAAIAYLIEKPSLEVTTTPAGDGSGDTIAVKLVSSLAANATLLSPWASISSAREHKFTISFGDGSSSQNLMTTSTSVLALSSGLTSSSAEVSVKHCFVAKTDGGDSTYTVSIRAVTPFGNAAVWSGQVSASTTCAAGPSPSPGFSSGCRIAPSYWWSALF